MKEGICFKIMYKIKYLEYKSFQLLFLLYKEKAVQCKACLRFDISMSNIHSINNFFFYAM